MNNSKRADMMWLNEVLTDGLKMWNSLSRSGNGTVEDFIEFIKGYAEIHYTGSKDGNRIIKYNVGDKVLYLDNEKNRNTGIISDIDKTNDGRRDLYLINNYPYLRYVEEIIELCES